MHYEPKHLFDSPEEDPNEYPQMMDFIVKIETFQANGLGEFIMDNHPDFCDSEQTVFDWGCGPGSYLMPYKEFGMTVRGFDACPTAGQLLSADEFRRWDARFPFQDQLLFDGLKTDMADLSICFEVAEHLESHWADRLVDTICEHSKCIIFTGATPGQGGSYHYNEQPHEYWLEKFETRHGFKVSPFNAPLHEFLEQWRPHEQRLEVCGWLLNNVYFLEQ